MIDKDHVFARFHDNAPATTDRDRELLTIPRRRGAPGARVVEVVHVRSGAAGKDQPRRTSPQTHAATWEDGFPTRRQNPAAPLPEPPRATEPEPAAHVMPMWAPSPVTVAAEPVARAKEASPVAERAVAHRSPKIRQSGRGVADPFDTSDDGANCIRCGYRIEAAREKRGLLTCAECG